MLNPHTKITDGETIYSIISDRCLRNYGILSGMLRVVIVELADFPRDYEGTTCEDGRCSRHTTSDRYFRLGNRRVAVARPV